MLHAFGTYGNKARKDTSPGDCLGSPDTAGCLRSPVPPPTRRGAAFHPQAARTYWVRSWPHSAHKPFMTTGWLQPSNRTRTALETEEKTVPRQEGEKHNPLVDHTPRGCTAPGVQYRSSQRPPPDPARLTPRRGSASGAGKEGFSPTGPHGATQNPRTTDEKLGTSCRENGLGTT